MTKPSAAGQDFVASPEQVLSSLERVLASEEFADSAQLSRFLRFAVESRLSGEMDRLKESVIGVTVFRRGPDYDPKSDPIVRVEARRLRARLDSYYSRPESHRTGNGNGEPGVRIVLPKGGYAPIFESLQPPADAAAAAMQEGAPIEPASPELPPVSGQANPPKRFRSFLFALAGTVAIGLIAFAGFQAVRPAPLTERFWSSLLAGDQPALVIPADTGLVMFQDLVRQAVPLRDYITGEFRAPYASNKELTGSVSWSFAGRRYTSATDLEFSVNLSRRREAARNGVRTRFARDVRVEDLQGTNLILLGPRHMNPWVELFQKNATFHLDHNEATSEYRLVNTNPGANEIRDALISSTDVQTDIYGIVNYHREGSRYVLIISGTAVAGIEAAAHFVADDVKLLPVLQKAEKNGRIGGFDVLLHGRNLGGKSPAAAVVALHLEQ